MQSSPTFPASWWNSKTMLLALVLVCVLATGAAGQSLRICTYNVLDRPTTVAQNAELQVILQAIGELEILGRAAPIDLLGFQEGPQNASVYDEFEGSFESVFNANFESTISTADFFGCRTGFIYNADRLILLNSTNLSSGLTHNTRRARFRPVDGDSSDEFYVYSIHLKAGVNDAAIRAEEAAIIRSNAQTLPDDANIIYLGDFNIRGSSESAFQQFLEVGDNASALDSWNVPFGFRNNILWNDNLAFQPFHTQDPTTNMDDRFDVVLFNGRLSDGIDLEFCPGSVTVLGNNGSHGLGQGVNTGNGADGFAMELVSFSDHLPVICDFEYGQESPSFNSGFQAPAVISRTVRSTGPVGGGSGGNFLNVEGSANGSFASFGVVDFDLSGQLDAGEMAELAGNLVLELKQSNAGFSRNGPVSVYVTTDAAAQLPIDGKIQYQAGQNKLDCVPTSLAEGAIRLATYAAVHRTGNGGGTNLPDGTLDPIRLFGEEIQGAILAAINGNGVLRLLITPDQPATAATYAGFNSTLGGPRLAGDLDIGNGMTDVLVDSFNLGPGVQGSGNLDDLNISDDNRIRFLCATPDNVDEPWLALNFTGTLPTSTPATLSVALESRANTPNVELTLELFDFVAGSWEQVAVSEAQLSDELIEITPSGKVSRFVGADNLVLGRAAWRPTGAVVQMPWACDIDLFKWSITP